MQDLLAEAQQIPAEAVGRARSIAWIKPPDHLSDLVPRVRKEQIAALRRLHAAIDQRLTNLSVGSGERGAFYAASELALIAQVWHRELAAGDRTALRACWQHLLAA